MTEIIADWCSRPAQNMIRAERKDHDALCQFLQIKGYGIPFRQTMLATRGFTRKEFLEFISDTVAFSN